MRFIDLTGKQFGRLTALYTNGRNGKGNIIWHCKCQCGNETDVLGINLRNGATRSCGCLFKETHKVIKKPNDLTNQKFGKLTALEIVGKNSIGAIKWRCRCDCGNYRDVVNSLLLNGKVTACLECSKLNRQKDITGQRFGNLTALYSLNKTDEHHSIIWHCKCICDNELDISLMKLKSGSVFSCGCSKKPKNPTPLTDKRVHNLIGQRFGKLTVIADTGKSNRWGKIWLCQCDCGNTKEVDSNKLHMKSVTSCGCLRKDLTEYKTRHLEGQQFGQLTVLEYAGKNKYSQSIWKCKCSCGNITYITGNCLISGNTHSCGCLRNKNK